MKSVKLYLDYLELAPVGFEGFFTSEAEPVSEPQEYDVEFSEEVIKLCQKATTLADLISSLPINLKHNFHVTVGTGILSWMVPSGNEAWFSFDTSIRYLELY